MSKNFAHLEPKSDSTIFEYSYTPVFLQEIISKFSVQNPTIPAVTTSNIPTHKLNCVNF